MKKSILACLAAVLIVSVAAEFPMRAQQLTSKQMTADQLTHRKQEGTGFPDFGFMVPAAEYIKSYSDQPIFHLKADFPRELPRKLPEFLEKIDFKQDPHAYIEAVRDYAFEGNIPTWDPYQNHIREWYHIPWLHPTAAGGAYPPNGGTEGFHGMIKEAPISAYQLAPGQKGKDGNYSVYAITLVNDFAGYAMGKMWADPNNPDPRVLDHRYGGGFPVGTVFAKLLFTDAPQHGDVIPFLKNPLQWKAYITATFFPIPPPDPKKPPPLRSVGAVNLLQMDIAVRDARADGPGLTGWVFGTFVYNGELNHENKFMNLVPAGLMWGNDPDDTTNKTDPFPPTHTKVNPNLKQSVIFDNQIVNGKNALPPQHLGWNGRLNGPADLNTTSCMSCHITAQYPQVTSLVPPNAVPDGGSAPPVGGGGSEWMQWFQNIKCATSFDARTFSTDFSFQVAIALQNFADAKAAVYQGYWAADYELAHKPIARGPVKKEDAKPQTKAKP